MSALTPIDQQSLSDLIGLIYDCVIEPELWPQALSNLCGLLSSDVATLSVLDVQKRSTRFSAVWGDPGVVGPLMTTYAAEMPLYHVVPKTEIDEPITLKGFCALAGPNGWDVMMSSRIGVEWFVPNNFSDAFCLTLIKQSSRIGALVVNVDADREPISQHEIRDLAFLAPHIRRAVTIGDLFEVGQREAAVFREVVDTFATGVMIVSSDMRLLYANAAAEALLSAGVLVHAADGHLRIENLRARSAVETAVTLGERSEVALGPSGISVPLAMNSTPAVAHVLPLGRRQMQSRFHNQASAAIFVATSGGNPISAVNALGSLFGLTAAECRVAAQVASGLTRAEIALGSGLSDGTIKSQLNAIFDKTGTGNQRQLEMLIRDLSPPIAPN